MNYKLIYDTLITKRKNNIISENFHKHHIIPKCMGGTNNSDNLVNLTYREHYIAHVLLAKIYKHTKHYFKLLCAVQRMGNSGSYKINSHTYSKLIKERNKRIGEISKIKYKNMTVYKHILTNEYKLLNINSEEVKSGEYVGINKFRKMEMNSKRMKNKIIAKDKNNNTVIIDKNVFYSTNEYVGINKGKTGLFDSLNEQLRTRPWYIKLMFFDLNNTHIKENNKNIFGKNNIFILYDEFKEQIKNKRINWKRIQEKVSHTDIFIKKIDKPLYCVIEYFRKENWNPYNDKDFLVYHKLYNKILGEHYEN